MHVQRVVTECKTLGLEGGQMLFMNVISDAPKTDTITEVPGKYRFRQFLHLM